MLVRTVEVVEDMASPGLVEVVVVGLVEVAVVDMASLGLVLEVEVALRWELAAVVVVASRWEVLECTVEVVASPLAVLGCELVV